MLFQLFRTFFKIGLFTLGGGYAMLPVIQKEVVERKSWITEEEFLNALSLSNSLPGPLAVNSASFVGYKIKKLPGAFAAVAGTVLPSILIILILAAGFTNFADNQYVQYVFMGIRPAVTALILYAVYKLARSAQIMKNANWLIALLSFLAIAVLNIHPIVVIVCAAVYGLILNKVKGESKDESDAAS